jgi:hypothetical protein
MTPRDPAAMIIFRVLDEAHWASVAGDDKKLRANMVRQFFNEMAECRKSGGPRHVSDAAGSQGQAA